MLGRDKGVIVHQQEEELAQQKRFAAEARAKTKPDRCSARKQAICAGCVRHAADVDCGECASCTAHNSCFV